jgi:hypothetical protein
MIITDRDAFERHWASRRQMMGQGPWLQARGRALVAFNAERVREGAAAGGRAAAESLSPEERTERARSAARASHSPRGRHRAGADSRGPDPARGQGSLEERREPGGEEEPPGLSGARRPGEELTSPPRPGTVRGNPTRTPHDPIPRPPPL